MTSSEPAPDGAASRRPRRSPFVAVLVALATVTLGVFCSAALADLNLGTINFFQVLPWLLLGEGLVYLLMLGGGSVAAPTLFTAWFLGFIFRAGIAVLAHMLSPAPDAPDLQTGAQFYYASYWAAAVADVLLVAAGLRLIRPVIARRRRRARPRRVTVRRATDSDALAQQDQVLEALAESPDAPPRSTTVLEELQIGDLAEVADADSNEEIVEHRWDLVLPLLDEADGDSDSEDEPELEPEPEEEVEPEPVDDTAKLEPVVVEEKRAEASVESLQGMVDVLASRAGGEGEVDIRVWRTADQRTVLAVVPAGSPAANASGLADSVVRGHLRMCASLDALPTSVQVIEAREGACVLRGLDDEAGLLLMAAGLGVDAPDRLQTVVAEVADALAEVADAVEPGVANGGDGDALELAPDDDLRRAFAEATGLMSSLPPEWFAGRAGDDLCVGVAGPEGADVEGLARVAMAGMFAAEDFVGTLDLGELSHLAVIGPEAMLAVCPARVAQDPALMAALTSPDAVPSRVAAELRRVALEAGL